MKYRYTRKEIAKKLNEYLNSPMGQNEDLCDEALGNLLATKPTKVKKIKKLSLTTPYWLITENGGVEEIYKTKFITDKINEIIDLLNTIINLQNK